MNSQRSVTLVTWNVQGAHGVDVAGIAGVIGEARPDVVVLQEVQRRQARRLADALGMHHHWAFKHLPVVTRAEGAAVLTPHRLVGVSRVVLRRAWWWSWRRRIAVIATIGSDAEGDVTPCTVVNVHLSPHDEPGARRTQAAAVAQRAPHAVVAGDFNDRPGGASLTVLTTMGWTDAWAAAHPDAGEIDGATNWTVGPRLGRPPTQRLDYVMAPPRWRVLDAEVLAGRDRLDWFAARSDHLPLLARLAPP